MKTNSIILALALAASAFFPCAAQQTKLLTADKFNDYGVVYSLPVTSLLVEVTATREVRHAGPYFQYAKKYVGTDKVVKEDAEVWTLSSVKITPVGIPDNNRQYSMQLKPGALTYLGVAADGMLLSINKEPAEPAAFPESADVVVEEEFQPNEYLQYVDGDFIASQSKAKQAQMLAESLMEIREAKIALTRGTAETMPTDGKQLELMLNSLSHQEKAITAAFLGYVTHETVSNVFSFTPSDEGASTLFRLSNFAGFVDADDYSGDPVTVDVKITNRGAVPLDARGEERKFPKDGVAYCVPGTARVAISYLGKTILDQEQEFSQFGTIFALNPALFTDKKNPSYAVFNPATGALEEIGEASE